MNVCFVPGKFCTVFKMWVKDNLPQDEEQDEDNENDSGFSDSTHGPDSDEDLEDTDFREGAAVVAKKKKAKRAPEPPPVTGVGMPEILPIHHQSELRTGSTVTRRWF